VFSGPTATIHNSQPLVTSNKARAKYGLPLRLNPDGSTPRFDALRPQRLAAPVTIYVEQFSAHPLEADAEELYAPPDGYLDKSGTFHPERIGASDVPVYEVTIQPQDGLYWLPYMGRQANGAPWEDDGTHAFAPADQCRQPFYPDASRIFEEIDRLGIASAGVSNLLSAMADFDFYRAAPPGGYKKGLPAHKRTDVGDGDIAPETLGADFFPYRPSWLMRSPQRATLARATNLVQRTLASGEYAGGIWLEGSPSVEESTYWFSLLIDTTVPLVGNSAQRPHGTVSNDGDHNIIDSVDYICSRVWADEEGRDRVGVVVAQEKQIFASREVQKGDARPGGYVATGGHGGIIGRTGEDFPGHPTTLTFIPNRRHTYSSEVRLTQLPNTIDGVRKMDDGIGLVAVPIRDASGDLLPTAIPKVAIIKGGGQYTGDAPLGEGERDLETEVGIRAAIDQALCDAPLAGFVGEGMSPYGMLNEAADAMLRRAVFSGQPVVKVGRGNNEGFAYHTPPFIAGGNLTASKARLLLMACLMKYGSPPPAANPDKPTASEKDATSAVLQNYQAVFDTH
jgi:L-asparaginase